MVPILRHQMSQVALNGAGELSDAQPINAVQLVRPADNAAFDLPTPDTEANDPLGLRHALGQLALSVHAAPPPFRLPAGDARKPGWLLPILRETSRRQQRPTRSPRTEQNGTAAR